jgi:hypothetical protein
VGNYIGPAQFGTLIVSHFPVSLLQKLVYRHLAFPAHPHRHNTTLQCLRLLHLVDQTILIFFNRVSRLFMVGAFSGKPLIAESEHSISSLDHFDWSFHVFLG